MDVDILKTIVEENSKDALHNLCNETKMIVGLIRGEERAFNELFDLYHHSVYRHVLRFVKSPNLAADIVQDVFVKVWEVRSTLKPDRSIRPFIFTIAKNHVLNVLRRASVEKAVKMEIMSHAVYSYTGNEDEVIYTDLTRFAEEAIQNLPTQRRLIFVMHKEQGKDFHQIAAILGISKNTVRDHLAKATKFVRSYLRINAEVMSVFAAIGIYG